MEFGLSIFKRITSLNNKGFILCNGDNMWLFAKDTYDKCDAKAWC